MTAIFNTTHGSTLAAICVHWWTNSTGELLHLPDPAQWDWAAIWAAAAVGLLLASRGRLLRQTA